MHTLGMKVSIAEKSVQRLERRTNALRIRPCAGEVHQGQSTTVDHGLNGTQQHAAAQRMHRTQRIAQTLLQYFACAHGVVSSWLRNL